MDYDKLLGLSLPFVKFGINHMHLHFCLWDVIILLDHDRIGLATTVATLTAATEAMSAPGLQLHFLASF